MEVEYEVNANEAAPNATCKGVIRRVDIRDSQAMITRNIVHDLNPLVLAAKRLRTSGSVIVLFDGLKVPNFVRYGSTLRAQQDSVVNKSAFGGATAGAQTSPRRWGTLTLQESHQIQAPFTVQGEKPL
ncbi:hypothetical protein HPB49_002180 [Dermacentor silvarum]|uniref:Uncharacterized protein n=1 Tax=Dermacentor silvarum TaxID=543639 RepID=A0ACB8CUM7_DERSI|nr:hypothetical protein HPB49_002180 [Dermacentor silvarum]